MNLENHYADVYTLLKVELLVIEAAATSRGIEMEKTYNMRLYDIVKRTNGDSDYTIEFNDG